MVVSNQTRFAVLACGVAGEQEKQAFLAEWRTGERVYEDAVQHTLPTPVVVDTSLLEQAFEGTAALACPRCGGTDVSVLNVQNRSKDEAETSIMTCKTCGCRRVL